VNILEIEDMIKGLPDQALQKEAKQPTGQVPQFLVVSEIQRRGDMRQRFQKRQENQGTVKDQVMQQGIAAMGAPQPEMQALAGAPSMPPQGMPPQGMQQGMPPQMPPQMPMQQPPMGMYAGGVVQMANGSATPFVDDPRLAELRAQGLTDEQIAQEIRRLELNESQMAQLGLPTLGTMEATMQPDAYSQDAYADIFARQQGNIPAGMEFIEPRTTDDLLSPQVGFTTREMAQSQTLPNVPDEMPMPSQRGIGSAPEGTADALQAQIQSLRSTPASPVAQAGFAMPDFAMPDFASYRQAINTSLAPPPATGRRDVGNLLGSDMLPPSSVDGSAPVSAPPAVDNSALAAQLVAESQARRNQEAGAAVGTFDAPPTINNALIEELIAGSEERRNREPSPAVGTFDAPAPQDTALIEQLIAGSEARRGREASPAVGDFTQSEESMSIVDRINQMMAGPELTEEQKAFASQRRPVRSRGPYGVVRSGMGASGAKSIDYDLSDSRMSAYQDIVAKAERGEPLTMGERTALPSYREEFGSIQSDITPQTAGPLAAAFEAAGIEIPGVGSPRFNMAENLIDIANNQSSAVQVDAKRGVETGTAVDPEVVDLAGRPDTASSASDRSTSVDQKDTNRDGAAGKSVQGTGSTLLSGLDQRIADYKTALTGEGSGALNALNKSNTLADAIRDRQRPGLDYSTLIQEYEDQMRPEMEALSRERGSQALLALGAGIAKGDLSSGLSGAAKAVAASNAERRALKSRQQAAQMGLKKSQIDAAYQKSLSESEDEIKALTVEVNAMKDFGLTQAQAEKAAFQQGAAYDLAIAKLEQDGTLQRARDERDEKKQQNLLRTAALDGAKEYLRNLDEMTVQSLGANGLLALYNRTASELAARLGVGFEGVDTVKEPASAPKSIGGYSVSESP